MRRVDYVSDAFKICAGRERHLGSLLQEAYPLQEFNVCTYGYDGYACFEVNRLALLLTLDVDALRLLDDVGDANWGLKVRSAGQGAL
jgi:hypothetical protein